MEDPFCAVHTFCVRPDNNKDDKKQLWQLLKSWIKLWMQQRAWQQVYIYGYTEKVWGLKTRNLARRHGLFCGLIARGKQKQSKRRYRRIHAEKKTRSKSRLTVNNKLIDSNLVIENRTLSRFIKPVSGRIVNKVNIATLERKDIRGQFQNQHFRSE